MSDQSVAQFSEQGEIPCLLVPLMGTTLLIPTVTIAEMAPMQPAESIPDTPDWLIGLYHWRNQAIPLLSYEVLNGAAYSPLNPAGRVAVMNNTGVDERLPFVAVPTQGIPRMAKVSKEDITENTDAQKKPFDLMAVRVGVEELSIPDVAALETAFLELNLLKSQ